MRKIEGTRKPLVMNEVRTAVINTLKDAEAPLTLADISAATGLVVKSGSTNALVERGLIKVAGTKKVQVIAYREVNTYALDLDALEKFLADAEK